MLRELGYPLEAVPWVVLEEILSFRSYAQARDALIRAEQSGTTLSDLPGADLVREIRARVRRAQFPDWG